MAVMAVPGKHLPVIKAENVEDFIKEFNDNVISDEQLKLCEMAGKLFKIDKLYES